MCLAAARWRCMQRRTLRSEQPDGRLAGACPGTPPGRPQVPATIEDFYSLPRISCGILISHAAEAAQSRYAGTPGPKRMPAESQERSMKVGGAGL